MLLGAETQNRPHAERRMRRHDHAGRGALYRNFFDRQGVADVVHPRAAIGLGHEDTHQPQFTQLLDDRGGELMGAVGFDPGPVELFAGEAPHHVANADLVVGQLEVHWRRSLPVRVT